MTDKNNIADRLVELQGKLSNQVFADKLGVSKSTLFYYLKGRIPPADLIGRVCDLLFVNSEWLLTGKGEKFKEKEIDEALDTQLKTLKKTLKKKNLSIYNKVVKQIDGMVDLNYEAKQLIMQLCRVYYLSDDIGRGKLQVLLAALDPGEQTIL